jgi:hypothetical protein
LERFEKLPEGLSIKTSRFPSKEKLTVAQAHSGKVTHALPSGMVEHDGVLGFRRHPHAAARALLLKVYFLQRPQVDTFVAHQILEFFLCAF